MLAVDVVTCEDMLPLRLCSTRFLTGSPGTLVAARCRSSGSDGVEAVAGSLLRAKPVTLAFTTDPGVEGVLCVDLKGDGALVDGTLSPCPDARLSVGGDATLRAPTAALELIFARGLVGDGGDIGVADLTGEPGREYALFGDGGRIRP